MGVSHELLETLMRGMVQDLRVCRTVPSDEDARSNLMWRCALWGSRFFQLGRRFSFPPLPLREAAILSSSDWAEYAGALAVLLLAHCRRESERHPDMLAQLAHRVWEVPETGRDEQEAAQADIRAFADFLRELELPTRIFGIGRCSAVPFEAICRHSKPFGIYCVTNRNFRGLSTCIIIFL